MSSWLSVHVAGVVGQAWLERNVAKELMAFPDSFPQTYTCPKCGSKTYETGQIRVSGGCWSSFFDVGNKCYNSVSRNVVTPSSTNALSLAFKRCSTSLVDLEGSQGT